MANETARNPLSFEMQRRSGQRKSFLNSIAAPESTAPGSFCPHIDELDQDRLEATRELRSSIFTQETEDKLAVESPEFSDSLSNGTLGAYVVQAIALAAATMAYVLPVIIINWAKTVCHVEETGKPIKVSTFLEPSVVIFSKGSIVMGALCVAFIWDCQGGSGYKYVSALLNWREIVPWSAVGGGYALADVAEIMANGKVDAATYTIMSQSRLVGTALTMRFMIGSTRSYFQWSILLNLSLALIGWQLIPNDFSKPGPAKETKAHVLGYAFTLLKIILSILCGVLSQKMLQRGNAPMIIQQGQACFAGLIFSMLLTPILVFVLYPAMGMPWTDKDGDPIGFFEGQAVPSDCTESAGDPTGWSSKTIAVLGVYVYREVVCTYCIKRFSALIKNICNAIALIVTYSLSVFVMHELPSNLVKFIIAIVIMLEVFHYGLAEPPKV